MPGSFIHQLTTHRSSSTAVPPPVLLAGGSHPLLAQQVAAELTIQLGQVVTQAFTDGERRVAVHEPVIGRDVYCLQSTARPAADNWLELLQLIASARAGRSRRITAVVPFFGYGRQDRRVGEGSQAPTAGLMAQFLRAAGASRIMTVDLHSAAATGLITAAGLEHRDLSAASILAPAVDRFCQAVGDGLPMVVVAPDQGAAGRAQQVAAQLGCPVVMMQKQRRDQQCGAVTSQVVQGSGAGRLAVVVDDEINTGGTLLATLQQLTAAGAHQIIAVVSHLVCDESVLWQLRRNGLQQLVITDSIALPLAIRQLPWVQTVSVAPLVARAIRDWTDSS